MKTASLREKIGLMLLAGFRGPALRDDDPIARDLAEGRVGSVLLFDEDLTAAAPAPRNIESPAQLRALTRSLGQCAATPPLIAIDQEGGRVSRLNPARGFPETISAAELGRRDDPDATRAAAEKIAATLADAGIHWNLAPVVDLAVRADNPIIHGKQRSFSSDPQAVARHAAAFIQAHRARGVLTCVKHFPGHGSAAADTHEGFVDVTAAWSEAELEPFARLIASGLADAVMTAHVFNARLDAARPATLSRPVIDGILRRRLGFDGVVVSDDLGMKAITSRYTLDDAIRAAIGAGVDILCFGNNLAYDPEIVRKAGDAIERMVAAGEIAATRIDESAARIARLRAQVRFD